MPYKDKQKQAEYHRKYRETHKKEAREYQKKYHRTHKQEIKEQRKKYYEEHKQDLNQIAKEYNQTHKKEIKEQRAKHYQIHKEEIGKCNRIYNATHKEERRVYAKEYYKKLRENQREQREERKEQQEKNREAYREEIMKYKKTIEVCSHCRGKELISLHHFPLPQWLNGKETIPLCQRCHVIYEGYFRRFLQYGTFKYPRNKLRNKNIDEIYRLYTKTKEFSLTPIKYIHSALVIRYNVKTGYLVLYHRLRYKPKKKSFRIFNVTLGEI